MIDAGAFLPRKIGRPWHGRIDNAADGLSATLTLANATTRPWPYPLDACDAWLLRRPVATARLVGDVHAGNPGLFPPPDAPDWPLTTAEESAQGKRILDYSLQPNGTGAAPWLLTFAADGTPWVIGVAVEIVGAEIVYALYGIPYGRIGRPPADWIALAPRAAGEDRLDANAYLPTGDMLPLGPLTRDPAALLSVSGDGKKWLMKVSAPDPEERTDVHCVLGLYEVIFSGGAGATPPVFRLQHRMGWTQTAGTYMPGVGYSNIVIHAWYTALGEIETVELVQARDPNDGVRGSLTWYLMAGARVLAQAYLRATAPVTLNNAALPGAIAGEYAVIPAPSATSDIRRRHLMRVVLRVLSGAQRELLLSARRQSRSLISLYALTTNVAGTAIDGYLWIGAGTPGTQDPTTLPDTATVLSVIDGNITYAVSHPHGAWHPVTGETIRCSDAPVSFA
ncbi:MAG: hypothetical protein Q8O33_04430 [Pseudomonadota bacterium]|nr:hypothetical protein [Pseudomonadota bacterium]